MLTRKTELCKISLIILMMSTLIFFVGDISIISPTAIELENLNISSQDSGQSYSGTRTRPNDTTHFYTGTTTEVNRKYSDLKLVSNRKRVRSLAKTFIVCPVFSGGLGNMMFEFASSFGIARSKGMNVAISSTCELLSSFKLNHFIIDIRDNMIACHPNNVHNRNERQPSAYDPKLLKFENNTNVRLTYFLQSFFYFQNYSTELKNQFIFKDEIRNKAVSIFNDFLHKFNITNRKSSTIIGVHVRRGNMVNSTHGYNVATRQYLSDAVNWYKGKYNNLYFIAASNDIKCTQTNLPKNISVEYLTGNSPAVDMATVSMSDHFISTVGSFSWWCGWLTGGHVTYYKWPAKEKSKLRSCYSKNYTDYFLPDWIGL